MYTFADMYRKGGWGWGCGALTTSFLSNTPLKQNAEHETSGGERKTLKALKRNEVKEGEASACELNF